MNYTALPLFQLLRGQMDYASARQANLAQNVANVDTPAYVPQDLARPDFAKMMQGTLSTIQMRLTQPGHIQAKTSQGGNFKTVERKETYETNFNKNKVVLEEEMKKISETQMQYQTAVNLYRKTVDLFKTAAGRPSGA